MSKRFGRNQKRRFRNEVAALTAQLLKDQKSLNDANRNNHKLRTIISDMYDDIKSAFNEHHPLGRRTTMQIPDPHMEQICVASMDRLPFSMNPYESIGPTEISHRVAFLMRLEGWDDKFKSQIMIRVSYEGKCMGYALDTMEVLRHRGPMEEVTQHFAVEISKVLMKGMTKGVMR